MQPTGVFKLRGKAMAERDFRPSFDLGTARKDVRQMLEITGERKLAVLPGLAARMDELLAEGLAKSDIGILARGD